MDQHKHVGDNNLDKIAVFKKEMTEAIFKFIEQGRLCRI
jgi:hypothetical protein